MTSRIRWLMVVGLTVLFAGGPIANFLPQAVEAREVRRRTVRDRLAEREDRIEDREEDRDDEHKGLRRRVRRIRERIRTRRKGRVRNLIIKPGVEDDDLDLKEDLDDESVCVEDLSEQLNRSLNVEEVPVIDSAPLVAPEAVGPAFQVLGADSREPAAPMAGVQSLSLAAPALVSVAAEPLAVVDQVPPGSRVLVLYDAPSGVAFSKFGKVYAIMLRNLLGHFKLQVDLVPVQDYAAGMVENYSALFYLGSYFDNPLPQDFLADAVATQKIVVWFKYNIWKLAWNASYDFNNRFGFAFYGLRGLNAAPSPTDPEPGFFDTVLYKGQAMKKYYSYDGASGNVFADPDVGVTQVLDPAKAEVVVPVQNSVTQEQIPYIVRSGNFWYVADIPLSYIGPRDRYLAAADVLHDMLGVHHAESHKAMVRFEDVSALVDPQSMAQLSDFLSGRQIPFSIATIPLYRDPFGQFNSGVPLEIPLAEAPGLLQSLAYAAPRGGDVLLHGLTHQYDETLNPHSGVSADDFEFWNVVTNSPVAEDSVEWAADRIATGLELLVDSGFAPFAFETPHYQGSPNSYRASSEFFIGRYGRAYYYTAEAPQLNLATGDPNRDFAAGQFFPYIIYEDYYGQIVIPENIGNIEYDISHIDPISNVDYPWTELMINAEYVLTVRDGYASFFFHPFWLEEDLGVPGFADFQSLIDGITNLGYSWVGAKTELEEADSL